MADTDPTIGQLAAMACVLEASIPKPGNVHRGADFADSSLYDFLLSGVAIGTVLDRARDQPLGKTVLDACLATRQVVDTNTNLGMVLLLAPLAKVQEVTTKDLQACIADCDETDCENVYAAIRICQPGGLGKTAEQDVHETAPGSLFAAMQSAADRDMIARQYSNGFHDLLTVVVPTLEACIDQKLSLVDAVVHTHLSTMAEYPDTLIRRKTDVETAETSAALAADVIQAGPPGSQVYLEGLANLDFWLRSDGNRRNPGTTADLITAAIFVCLARQTIQRPLNFAQASQLIEP